MKDLTEKTEHFSTIVLLNLERVSISTLTILSQFHFHCYQIKQRIFNV
jgi:hypothetical protein